MEYVRGGGFVRRIAGGGMVPGIFGRRGWKVSDTPCGGVGVHKVVFGGVRHLTMAESVRL
ncbi:hypothetical protein BPNSA17_39850 [Bordetella petrii]